MKEEVAEERRAHSPEMRGMQGTYHFQQRDIFWE